MLRPYLISFLLMLGFLPALAQYPLGNWREHLPYLHAKLVVPAGDRIFCAGDESLFAYDLSDNSIERFSKLNGLNDFGVSALTYSSDYHYLMIAYANANIDLLTDDNQVINLSDIKRKNIPGDKNVYSIYMSGRYAYLACGFGVVVFDLQRKEIKDTYYIGAGGASVKVFEVSEDDQYLYAATADAIFRANKNSNLSDFNNWEMILTDGGSADTYNHAGRLGSKMVFCQHRSSGDTLLVYDGNFGVSNALMSYFGVTYFNAFRVKDDKLSLVNEFSISTFDNSFQRIRYIDGTVLPDAILMDATDDASGDVWAADHLKGLNRIHQNQVEYIIPDGPASAQSSMMLVNNGKLRVAHGPRTRGWGNQYAQNGFSLFEGASWSTQDGYKPANPLFANYNFFDAMTIAVDPVDDKHYYVGSGGAGMLEMYADEARKIYRDTNSTLQRMVGNTSQIKAHGMDFDAGRNLWVANSGVATVLNVLKLDGTWKTFSLTGAINSSSKTGDLLVDSYGYIWCVVYENIGGKDGILFYNTKGTLDNAADDEYDIAELSSIRVRCIAEDKEGTLWAGTDKGVYVFYPPSLTPQKILIRQDNTYQYLLETDVVTAIAVDAANRKWIGTEAGGVYLFSADGLTQVSHFTTQNSPLFSDNISAIAIDGSNGEVYIGTDKGILSYRSDAVEGEVDCASDILIYPSPVSSNYTGPIAIRGLVDNGIVKITDISGKLVFETRALGSQAIWNGTNFEGERVSTGVYLVLSANKDGANSCVTKLVISH